MRTNFGPQSWIYPEPVLIIGTYDADGKANAMNAAWGGIHDTNEIGICLSTGHKTTKNILENKAFTVSFAVAKYTKECDYLGMVTGNKVEDKLERAGLHTEKASKVNAPVILELPLCLECEFIHYDEDSGYLTAKIVNVNADESILTNGKVDVDKLEPIAFDPANNQYRKLGEVTGKAFSNAKLLA